MAIPGMLSMPSSLQSENSFGGVREADPIFPPGFTAKRHLFQLPLLH